MNLLRHRLSEKSKRLYSVLNRLLLAFLAIAICSPIRLAVADSVLELPQVSSPSSDDAPEVPTPRPHRTNLAPLPENLGTLQDYERSVSTDPSMASASAFPNP